MKKVLLIVLLSLVLSFSIAVAEQSVMLESVSNILDDTTLQAGNPHSFEFHLKNDSAITYNIVNGFRIYSPDGATWGPIVGSWLNSFNIIFTVATINEFSTGSGEDTVGFSGVGFSPAAGLPAGYDNTAWEFTLNTVAGDIGKHICIDSSIYGPGGAWKWAPLTPGGHEQILPTWSGPHCFRILDELLAVGDNKGDLPTEFALAQNYPNPFNPTTNIKFDVPNHAHVTLKIYNILGQEVETLVNGELAAGRYIESWDASSHGSGIYFYRLEADSFVQTKKLVLLK